MSQPPRGAFAHTRTRTRAHVTRSSVALVHLCHLTPSPYPLLSGDGIISAKEFRYIMRNDLGVLAESSLINEVYHQLKSTKKQGKDLTRTDLMVKLSKLSRKEDKAAKKTFLSRQDTSKSFAQYASAIALAQAMGATSEPPNPQEELQRQPSADDEPRDSTIQEEPEEDVARSPVPPPRRMLSKAPSLKDSTPAPSPLKKSSSLSGRFKIKVELPEESKGSNPDNDDDEYSESSKKASNMHAVRSSIRKKVIQVWIGIPDSFRNAAANASSCSILHAEMCIA